MWRITLVGLFAHKVRYALTALAVLLGVAFMAGTLVFTDTIGRTFDGLFTDVYHDTSAVVRAKQPFTPQANFANQRQKIDADLVDQVRAVPGVAEVRVGIAGYAQLVGKDGKAIGNPATGAPTLGEAWTSTRAMNPYRFLAGGRPPDNSSEVAIDKHSADVGHLRVGDRVVVLSKLAPAHYTVTGVFRWGTADSPLGASITLFDRDTAARVLGEPGKVDEIDVAARPGISQQQIASRLRAAIHDPGLEVVTVRQIIQEGQRGVRDALGFFNTFLLAFAVIALFVGSFLIFNTFSIVVAQRLRELALLRAVGASRTQVSGTVLGESLIIGLVASGAGLGAGLGLALGLRAMLAAFGLDIPSTGLLVSARTVVICLLLGTAITALAALGPALRAGRVAPIAALQQLTTGEETAGLRRAGFGASVTLAGLALLALGLFARLGRDVALVGAGAALVFLGIAVLGPLLSRPLSWVVGLPLQGHGPVGRMARLNAMRNPKRTSATAAALMVGVALVALMSVLASSIKSSIGDAIDDTMRADFVISGGQPGGVSGFSPTLQQRLQSLPEVAVATGIRSGTARVYGSTVTVLAVDPPRAADLFDIGVVRGDIGAMTPHGVAISQRVAEDKHLAPGQPVHVQFPTTGVTTFTVQAVYSRRDLAGDYVLSLAAAGQNFSQQLDFQVYAKLAPHVSATAGRQAIDRALADYPTAKLLDRSQYKAQQVGQIDQLLNLVYGLLALALIIALIGIANTLALSIHERTRELGLLHAVGMTRPQLRALVRWESVIIALLGATQGLVVGTAFGWALIAALHGQGVTQLSIPIRQLLVIAVLAGGAGVLAALAPGRHAARLDILRAISAE